MKNTWIAVAVTICLLVSGYPLPAQPSSYEASRPPLDKLRAELISIQTEKETAQREMEKQIQAFREKQHQLEYQDPEIVKLREELTALERQVLEKRERLKVRIAMNPDLKRLEGERKDLFQRLQQLRDTEAAIRQEIALQEQLP